MSQAKRRKDVMQSSSQEALSYCQVTTIQIQNAIESNSELTQEIIHINSKLRNDILTLLTETENKNEEQLKVLLESNETLKDKMKMISEHEGNIKKVDAQMNSAASFSTVGPWKDKIENINHKLKKVKSDLTGVLARDKIARRGISKNILPLERKMTIIRQLLTTKEADKEIKIKDKVHITIGDLREMSGPLKWMIREGKVFAVQHQPGTRRFAKIEVTDEADALLLHYLRYDVHIPPNSQFVKYNEVMSMVDTYSQLTFFELGVEGKSLGRVMIRLHGDNQYTVNFSCLCSGRKGLTYAKSKVLGLIKTGTVSEGLHMGDYEQNNGSGGSAVTKDVNWESEANKDIYKKIFQRGLVCGKSSAQAQASQFIIVTKYDPGSTVMPVFGCVEKGFNVLTKAISKITDMKSVEIVSCGLVLSEPVSPP